MNRKQEQNKRPLSSSAGNQTVEAQLMEVSQGELEELVVRDANMVAIIIGILGFAPGALR
jgi:hypothetical protein